MLRVCLIICLMALTLSRVFELFTSLEIECQDNSGATFTPDNRFVLFACKHQVTVMDVSTGKVHQVINVGSKDEAFSVVVTPNSTNIVIGVRNCQLQIWRFNETTTQFDCSFNETVGRLTVLLSVQLTSHEQLFYVGGFHAALIYNTSSKDVQQMIANESATRTFVVQPKTQSLIAFQLKLLGRNETWMASIYNLADYSLRNTIIFPNKTNRLRPSLSHKQDRLALTLRTDGQSSIFTKDLKKELGRMVGHSLSVFIPQWSWNDKFLITVSQDKSMIMWDGRTYLEKERYDLDSKGKSVALSCDSKHLFVTGDYYVGLFNVTDPSLFGKCTDLNDLPPSDKSPPQNWYLLFSLFLLSGIIAEAIIANNTPLNSLTALQGLSFIGWLLSFAQRSESIDWLTHAFQFAYLKFGVAAPTELGLLSNATVCVYVYTGAIVLMGVVALIKLKINTEPLNVFNKVCKWVIWALNFPMLYFIQTNKLDIPGVVRATHSEQISAVFLAGGLMMLMFTGLLRVKSRLFYTNLATLTYMQIVCIVLLSNPQQPTIALKIGVLHSLFVLANYFIQVKHPEEFINGLARKLLVVQGALEVLSFLFFGLGLGVVTSVSVVLGISAGIYGKLISKRGISSPQAQGVEIGSSALSEKREESSNINLSASVIN